ncbi:2-keto-4-pentenoate hydratase [Croceicoccus sediminis]|uniref:2-keto-4-pentenoate hydratase n=1 Tax=Croceicoccus sediminis TaxID=2571150 RepID=UPI0014794C88|nr:fumarylacetoacetate hydrolase family protein [Croceicoccus sediminis]
MTNDENNAAFAASELGEELARLYLAGKPSPPGWREHLTDIDMGYAVQDAIVRALADGGQGPLAGYKAGMTSKTMQQAFGIDSPIAGRVMGANMLSSGAQLRQADHLHLGLESELAFVLSRDIAEPLGDSDDAVLDHIANAHAAFEVVDDRHTDRSVVTAPSLVAENIWNVGAVLGDGVSPSRLGAIDGRAGRYYENGTEIETGSTSDVLGNPLNVVRWLANFQLSRGEMLRKGQTVLTGSITALRFPERETLCRFELDGLPAVEVEIV